MGEFRIGRSRAQHSYPEPRFSGAAPTVEFARNFATGPKLDQELSLAPVAVEWNSVDVAVPPIPPLSTVTVVQITPLSTGVVRVLAVLSLFNIDVAQRNALVQVLQNGDVLPFPAAEDVTVPAGGFVAVPILVEITGLALGVTVEIGIAVTASANDALRITAESSSLELEEVPVSTG